MDPIEIPDIPEVSNLCEWIKINVIPSSLEDEDAMNDFCSIGCNLSDVGRHEIIWEYVVFLVLPFNDLTKSYVIPILRDTPFYGVLVTENMKRKWKESTKILNHWFTRIIQRIYIDYIRLYLAYLTSPTSPTSPHTTQKFVLPYYQCGCVIRFHPLRKTFEFHKDESLVTGIIQLPAPGKILKSSCLPTLYISDQKYKQKQHEQYLHEQQSCKEEKSCVLRLHSRRGYHHKTPKKISTNSQIQSRWDKKTIRQRKQYYRQDENNNNPFISFIFGTPRDVDQTDFQQLKRFLSHSQNRQLLFSLHLIIVLYIGYICFDVLRKLTSSVKQNNHPLLLLLYSSLMIVFLNQLGIVFCIYRIFHLEIPMLRLQTMDPSLLRKLIQSSIVFYSLFLFTFFYFVYLSHKNNISTLFAFDKMLVYILYIIPFFILVYTLVYLNFTL